MNKRILLLELYHIFLVIGLIVVYPILIVVDFFNTVICCIRNKVNKKTVTGQVAVITGSGRGLGRDIAIELAKRGCHVAIVDIQEKLAQETANYIAKQYNVKTRAYKIDVTDYNQLVHLNNSVTMDLGDITILINNAGILTLSSMTNPLPQEIQQMINVNLTSICYAHQIFLPKMKELNYGHIVNISSIFGSFPSPLFDTYAATKSAVRSLTSSLRIEITLECKNITATTVMPTFLYTNKRVEKILNLSGRLNMMPKVEGDIAAKYVINSMLRGAREIGVPYSIFYFCRLLEFLPIWAKEICISAVLILEYNNIIKSSNIAKVLNTPDAAINVNREIV